MLEISSAKIIFILGNQIGIIGIKYLGLIFTKLTKLNCLKLHLAKYFFLYQNIIFIFYLFL